MYKSESPQSDKRKAWQAESSKAHSKLRTFNYTFW